MATVAVAQPEVTPTIFFIATAEPIVEATLEPTQTPVPTMVPEPTIEPTATLVPEPTPTLTPTPTPEPCPGALPWYEAINNIGAYTTVVGPVVDTAYAPDSRGTPTFLNLGLSYPDPGRFTVVIWIDGRWNFDYPPEETYLGLTICVTGTIELYEGSAEMIVEGPEWISVP